MMNDRVGKPRINIGCPVAYGSVSPQAANMVFGGDAADPRTISIIEPMMFDHVVLIDNFTSLLCHALELHDRDLCDYFCMLHADLSPEPWFLNKLLAELIRYNADVMAVVLPVKDHSRRTKCATAIARVSEPWEPPRLLTLEEMAEKYPPTFGCEHCCGPDEYLQVTDGLWLADLAWPGWDEFAFDTRCRQVKMPDGTRDVQTLGEDPLWSRFMFEHGARYFATTKIKCDHIGRDHWPNYLPALPLIASSVARGTPAAPGPAR
jgi:hypothetical protein